MSVGRRTVAPYFLWAVTVLVLCLSSSSSQAFSPTVAIQSSRSLATTAQRRPIPKAILPGATILLAGKRSSRTPQDDEEKNALFEEPAVNDLWRDADFLEIRLDATICACFVLARTLVFDMSLPLKQTPGYDIADLILISNAVSSATVLALLWTLAGLCTRNFQNGNRFEFPRLLATTAVAGPLWLGAEVVFQWLPPPESGGTLDVMAVAETVVTGSLGLLAVMSFCRAYVRLAMIKKFR